MDAVTARDIASLFDSLPGFEEKIYGNGKPIEHEAFPPSHYDLGEIFGAFRTTTPNGRSVWVEIRYWNKGDECYLCIFNNPLKKYGEIEAHKISENCLLWSYVPRKQDNRNEERKKIFEALNGTLDNSIPLPHDKETASRFLDSWLEIVDSRTAADELSEKHASRSTSLQSDLASIILDAGINENEKVRLTKERLGQGEFRRHLILHWNGKCSVTGCGSTELLIASHIKPWSASNRLERLNPFNGLLLTPNLDRAFNSGYITFDSKGRIRISQQLKLPNQLGIHQDMHVALAPVHEIFMTYHRRMIFREAR